jgi:hypothetical protein
MDTEADARAVVDARGVTIIGGDRVVYGFSIGRSVAMAEAVVEVGKDHVGISMTASGRVWVHVARRSYGADPDGTHNRRRVHIAPDRLVVVKALPPSPLPEMRTE